MQKLQTIIEQYGRWRELEIYIERIDAHVEIDFSLALENAKALLETIGKDICKQRSVDLPNTPNMSIVLKKSFIAIGYKGDDLVNQISTSLANIAQQMGNLRNDIGLTAHGKPMDEIRDRNNKVDIFTRGLLIDTTEIVATFLIRGFESSSPLKPTVKAEDDLPEYTHNQDFNDFWDEAFGEFTMGNYSYPPSEILYNVDQQAYVTEHKAFKVEAA